MIQVFKSRNFLGVLHKYRVWVDTSIKYGRPDLKPQIYAKSESGFNYFALYVPSELHTVFYTDSLPY